MRNSNNKKTGCLIQLASTTTVNHATMVANHSAVKLISQWQQLPMLLHSFVSLTVLLMKPMKFPSSLSRSQNRKMTPRKMKKRTIPMNRYLLIHPGNKKLHIWVEMYSPLVKGFQLCSLILILFLVLITKILISIEVFNVINRKIQFFLSFYSYFSYNYSWQ